MITTLRGGAPLVLGLSRGAVQTYLSILDRLDRVDMDEVVDALRLWIGLGQPQRPVP